VLNSPWAQGITSKVSSRPGYVPTTADRAATYAACSSHSLETLPKEHHLGAHDLERLDRMASVTATDRVSLIKAAKHYPPLVNMSVDAAVARMLLMKQLLPGAACLAHVCNKAPHSVQWHVHKFISSTSKSKDVEHLV
jgi:hypothetical protein